MLETVLIVIMAILIIGAAIGSWMFENCGSVIDPADKSEEIEAKSAKTGSGKKRRPQS